MSMETQIARIKGRSDRRTGDDLVSVICEYQVGKSIVSLSLGDTDLASSHFWTVSRKRVFNRVEDGSIPRNWRRGKMSGLWSVTTSIGMSPPRASKAKQLGGRPHRGGRGARNKQPYQYNP
jgi:hypothetical protein